MKTQPIRSVDIHPRSGLEPPASWAVPERHLDALLSSAWFASLLEVCDVFNSATHAFFAGEGARLAFAPVTTGSISSPMGLGSDSLPVKARIGEREVYLADSMQFALELAVRVVGKPAYYLLPSFRGEAADARHLNQFIHAEAELEGGLDDVIACVERYFRHLAEAYLADGAEHLVKLGGDLPKLERVAASAADFPRIRFAEAVALLADETGAFELCETGEPKITAAGERALLRRFRVPCWITHMPRGTVPFYQAVCPRDETVSLTGDLLAGIGETVGAGERARTDADVLANLERCGVDADHYQWYVEMKRRRPLRTSGFGLGMERFLAWATGRDDIRDFAFLIRNAFGEGAP